MSGIVLGWADVELVTLLDEAPFTVWRAEDDAKTTDIPVAVVPLDDATLAGMVTAFREGYNRDELRGMSKTTHSGSILAGLRAALGLEGGA